MKPVRTAHTITVARPRDEVYALLDDLAAHQRWTDHFLVDWELGGPARGVGATARFRAKGAGPNAHGEIEVIESSPGRIVEEGRGGKDGRRRTRGTYELRSLPSGGTEVTFISEVVQPANRLEALANPMSRAYLNRNNGRAMERLQALLAEPARTAA
jgi:uncharacterized protein YndB with AHSA1/START domain